MIDSTSWISMCSVTGSAPFKLNQLFYSLADIRGYAVESGSLQAAGGGLLPTMRATTKRTIKIKNRNLAKPVAAAAMPPNPKTPAIMAIIRNKTAHPSMMRPLYDLLFGFKLCSLILSFA